MVSFLRNLRQRNKRTCDVAKTFLRAEKLDLKVLVVRSKSEGARRAERFIYVGHTPLGALARAYDVCERGDWSSGVRVFAHEGREKEQTMRQTATFALHL